MRLPSGWRRVLAAWALVLIFAVGGFAVVELAPSLGLAKVSPELQGARIPQYDPFDFGPPPFENVERDFDAPGELTD